MTTQILTRPPKKRPTIVWVLLLVVGAVSIFSGVVRVVEEGAWSGVVSILFGVGLSVGSWLGVRTSVAYNRDAYPASVAGWTESNSAVIQHPALSRLPMMVRQQLITLGPEQQQAFLEEFDRKSKSSFVTSVFWLCGCHYGYLGNWGMQVLFWISWGGLFLWWLVDAFRIRGLTESRNQDIAIQVMTQLRLMAAPRLDVALPVPVQTGAAAAPASSPQAPAGWYPDPLGRHQYRYWDGAAWTDSVSGSSGLGHDETESPR